MSYLLDTNICSFHLKQPAGLIHRFTQYSGRLYLSTIVVAELYAWAYHRKDPRPVIQRIEQDLFPDISILSFDLPCAEVFGKIRGWLLQRGIVVARLDLMIASVALVHDLTLVTQNVADFQNVSGLRLEDWLAP